MQNNDFFLPARRGGRPAMPAAFAMPMRAPVRPERPARAIEAAVASVGPRVSHTRRGTLFQAVAFMAALVLFVPDARTQTLNPTGRTLDLVTPIVQDGRLIGDAALRIGADDTLMVDASGVTALLGDRINPDTAAAIAAAAGPDGRVPLSTFRDAGAPLDYDPSSLTLLYAPSRDALGNRSVSLGDGRIRPQNVLAPAAFSGFVNFRGGVQYEQASNGFGDDDGFELDDVDVEGAVRYRDVVVEGAVRYDEDDGDIRRRYVRAIHDDLDTGRRYVAGDYRTPFSGLVDGVDILGVAVENTGALNPFDNLRPRGRSSFELERTATVEIYANGIVERRLRLEPGIYDLTDIPLARGANDITVVVEDDLGRRELARFDQFFGDELLSQGRLLYSAAAGIVADVGADEPEYDEGRPALSAQVEYGLTDEITVGGATRLTTEQGVAGVTASTVTALGSFGLDLAGSYSEESGEGAGAELRWRYDIDRGDPLGGFRNEAISATVGLRSEDFIDNDPFDVGDGNDDYLFDFAIAYTRPLTEDISLGMGGFYGLASDDSNDSDRLQLYASVGGRYRDRYTWSVRGEYVQDDDGEDDEGFGIGIQLGVRLGENARASASYDSLDNRIGGNARYSTGQGVGSWSAGVATDRGDDDDLGATASASYTGNRFVASAFHREEFGDDAGDERSTGLRFGTAIAFAVGKVAIGRPVRGGFVIADGHPSLEDRSVILGRQGESYEAASGTLGPALASGYGAYRPARVATDVDDLPIGYDLGSGLVEIEPPYRAGHYIEIGSDAQITVTGTLTDRFGDPLDLATGIARNIDASDFPPIQVFTNRAGRFALLGAIPGVYRLEMSGGETAEVEAPIGAIGLVRVGSVEAR